MQIYIIVAIIFIVALAMVLQIDSDGQIYYAKPSRRKVEETGKHKGMHSAYCLHCNITKYVK